MPWTDTGIDIIKRSKVKITATGSVYIAGSDDGKTPAGAHGCIAAADPKNPPPAPGLTCLALVGRIGDGQPFEVGRSSQFIAPRSGRLLLGVNDNFFPDNGGSWSVRVVVTPP